MSAFCFCLVYSAVISLGPGLLILWAPFLPATPPHTLVLSSFQSDSSHSLSHLVIFVVSLYECLSHLSYHSTDVCINKKLFFFLFLKQQSLIWRQAPLWLCEQGQTNRENHRDGGEGPLQVWEFPEESFQNSSERHVDLVTWVWSLIVCQVYVSDGSFFSYQIGISL